MLEGAGTVQRGQEGAPPRQRPLPPRPAPARGPRLSRARAHPGPRRRRPEAGVCQRLPAVLTLLEEHHPVEDGRSPVREQSGEGGPDAIGWRVVAKGHVRHPGPLVRPQQWPCHDGLVKPAKPVEPGPADRQVHDGAGRQEVVAGAKFELSGRSGRWRPSAAPRGLGRGPRRGTLTGGTSVRWAATAPREVSPSARRRPSTSSDPGGSSSRATPRRCLGLMELGLGAGQRCGVAQDDDTVVVHLDEAALDIETELVRGARPRPASRSLLVGCTIRNGCGSRAPTYGMWLARKAMSPPAVRQTTMSACPEYSMPWG